MGIRLSLCCNNKNGADGVSSIAAIIYNGGMEMGEFKDKKVAVLGLGLDTQDVIPWLEKQGAKLTILAEPFGDLTKFDVLVRSPGVYRYRPEIMAAERAGAEITSSTKLFFQISPTKNIIGVTGTKGKGTTSTLIYEILKADGRDVYLGGNIGTPVFGFLDKLTAESWVVLELSSFQLIDLKVSPHIAVVLMVTSDHLDWHVGPEEYVGAKSTITQYQMPNDYVIANKDYENSRKIGEMGGGRKIWISRSDWTKSLRIRGEHNKENMAAAAAVAQVIGIRSSVIDRVAREFMGLEHRLEEVATVDGVTYFDDSISTVPETTMAAIDAFAEPKLLILGGSEKGSDFSELGRKISKCKSVKSVIVIGQMAERIKQAIGAGTKIVEGAKDMRQIVGQARAMARPGDVVLLSPAAASFDMFKSYKDRGEQFRVEVNSLK